MADNDPMQKHVEACVRKVIMDLFQNQPTRGIRHEAKEIANDVRWLGMAFDAMRGFDIEINKFVVNSVDDEDDPEEHVFINVYLRLCVGDQTEMEFIMGVEEDDIQKLYHAIKKMLSVFEVMNNGRAVPFLTMMNESSDMDHIFIAGDTIAFGRCDDDEDDFRMEISSTEILDFETGKPWHIRLIN